MNILKRFVNYLREPPGSLSPIVRQCWKILSEDLPPARRSFGKIFGRWKIFWEDLPTLAKDGDLSPMLGDLISRSFGKIANVGRSFRKIFQHWRKTVIVRQILFDAIRFYSIPFVSGTASSGTTSSGSTSAGSSSSRSTSSGCTSPRVHGSTGPRVHGSTGPRDHEP